MEITFSPIFSNSKTNQFCSDNHKHDLFYSYPSTRIPFQGLFPSSMDLYWPQPKLKLIIENFYSESFIISKGTTNSPPNKIQSQSKRTRIPSTKAIRRRDLILCSQSDCRSSGTKRSPKYTLKLIVLDKKLIHFSHAKLRAPVHSPRRATQASRYPTTKKGS